MMLSVTNRCNAHCAYCNIPVRRQREMSLAEITSLIGQIRALGGRRLGLWGGEPLLRDDIGEIISYARRRGLMVTLDSNGYLLPDKIEAVREVDHLILALDGPPQAHDQNRGTGSFPKAMAAIEAASGRIPLWTITVLTRHNLDAVDYILEKARDYGFLATFQVLHHNDRLGRNTGDLIPRPEDYRAAIQKIIEAKKRGAPVGSSLKYLRHILRWEDYCRPISVRRAGPARCWAGRLYCNIDTDGAVYPCSLLVEKIPAVNSLAAGFKTAFNALRPAPCAACTASCFTEYNYLYSLDVGAITAWLAAFRKSRRMVCKKKRNP